MHCHQHTDPKLAAVGDPENAQPTALTKSRIHAQQPAKTTKQIIYLDRNNTPDVWGDISRTIKETHSLAGKTDYTTVVLLPKQEPWDKTLYKQKNPICPHLIFECCKRIFGRKEHGCLNASNKPKVVDVVLKFAKLHDNFDFDDAKQIQSYFDHSVVLDFMRYSSRQNPLLPETLTGLIQAYNETPENFGSPSDETVTRVIALLERQLAIDETFQTPAAAE